MSRTSTTSRPSSGSGKNAATGKKATTGSTSARRTPTKKDPGQAVNTITSAATEQASAPRPTPARLAKTLPVRDGEDPWTKDEVAELMAELEDDVARQRSQIEIVDSELAGLLRDGNDGAGRDPADVGSTNFERDQEMSIAANARAMLEQSVDALERITQGKFGVCANCGQPIGKGRLQAFPRAVLCVTCKQREERR